LGNVTCSQCGVPIEDEPPIEEDLEQRKPCPVCGSRFRNVALTASAHGRASATAVMIVIPYAETLLTKARELVASGDFAIATVVAHMACEIAVERAIARAFLSKGLDYLESAITALISGYNLANDRNRTIQCAHWT
jgi:hypothetical protein